MINNTYLSKAVIIFFYMYGLLNMVIMIVYIYVDKIMTDIIKGRDYHTGQFDELFLWYEKLNFANFIFFVTICFLFLLWYYISYKNLLKSGFRSIERHPVWAAVSFFIPFVNLWIPYDTVKEMNTKYSFIIEKNAPGSLQVMGSFTITLWWISYLTVLFGNRILRFIGGDSDAEYKSMLVARIFYFVILISSVMFTVHIVSRLSKMEETVRKKGYLAYPPLNI